MCKWELGNVWQASFLYYVFLKKKHINVENVEGYWFHNKFY